MQDRGYTIFLYALFAIFATSLNILVQYIIFMVVSSKYTLIIAMCFGTLVGLVAKYVLDKKFIFSYTSKSVKQEAKNFFLYSFFGGIITFFYIALETLFYFFYPKDYAQYIGAFFGLSIGYAVKYMLDKNFIFKKES